MYADLGRAEHQRNSDGVDADSVRGCPFLWCGIYFADHWTKGMDPTVASLILSLESVVSLIAGWLILGQRLSNRELLGCALAFAAIILVQIPAKSK